jgi:hypothetical protein
MKIIKVQELSDGNGSIIYRPSEPFPTDTVYSTMIDKQYICYQQGDTLPEGAMTDPFAVIRENIN